MKMSHCPPTISVFLYTEAQRGSSRVDLAIPLGQPSASLALVLGQQGLWACHLPKGFVYTPESGFRDAGTRGCEREAEG